MPAFTSRLNLYKPGNGVDISPDEAADIDKINDNMDVIDDSVGAKVVTSGTRPVSPYAGQVIFETDTGDVRVRSGSTWAMANRSDRATWNVADFNALASLSSSNILKDGDLCTVQEGRVLFARIGGVWVQETVAVFADATARNTAYAKASGVFKVAGVLSRAATELFDRVYSGVGDVWPPSMSRVPILPSAVGGSGVALDSATGVVTAAGGTATTIILEGAFPTDIRDVELIFDAKAVTTASLTMQLRVGGTTAATAYDRLEGLERGSGPSSGVAVNQTSASITGWANKLIAGRALFMKARLAEETMVLGEVGSMGNPAVNDAANGLNKFYWTHRTATAYSGLVLNFSTAVNGTFRLEGIR